MRFKELQQGIEVQNEEGTATFGKSIAAGRRAVRQTAMSRFVLPVPIMMLPAFSILGLEKMKLWPKCARTASVLQLFIVTGSIMLAVPISISLFEQKSRMQASCMEPEFQNLKNGEGEFVQTLYYNKGL